ARSRRFSAGEFAKQTARASWHERRSRFQRRWLFAARARLQRHRGDDESMAARLHFAGGGQMLWATGGGGRAQRRGRTRHPALRGRRRGPVRKTRDQLFFE